MNLCDILLEALHEVILFRYEESIERNIELESKGDESQRKIADLEAELRRTKEKLNDHTNALRKMHEISQDAERLTDHKRTRSLSPGEPACIIYPEVSEKLGKSAYRKGKKTAFQKT